MTFDGRLHEIYTTSTYRLDHPIPRFSGRRLLHCPRIRKHVQAKLKL